MTRFGKVAFLDSTGRAIMQKEADVIQVLGPTPVFTEQCAFYARRIRTPLVFHLYSLPGLQTYQDSVLARLVDWAYKHSVLSLAVSTVDHAVFTSEELAESYHSYRGPYSVIPHSIQPCKCLPGPQPPTKIEYSSESLGTEVSLLFVGQLRPYKGVKYLLQALALLGELSGKRFCLTVAGDGPQKAFLSHMAHTLGLDADVRFLGAVSEETLHGLYMSHDVLVLPSVSAESFGLVLLEARRHGMQVIATNLPGVAELTRSLGGTVVPPRSPAELARAISTAPRVVEPRVMDPLIANAGSPADEATAYIRLYETLSAPSFTDVT